VSSESSEPAAWDARHLHLAIDAAGVALWSWNVDTDKLTMDGRGYDLWGVERSEFVCFEDLSAHIHPADRDRVRAAFAATRAIFGRYEIDFALWSVTRSAGYRPEARATMSE
jgi:PAS domain-containing protein